MSSDSSISDDIDGTAAPTGTVTPADDAAIRQTLARYCQLCDDGDFDHWVDVFTEDARFTAVGRTYTGRAALKAFMEEAQSPEKRGKHLLGQPVITGVGNRASGVTDFVFVRRAPDGGGYAVTAAGRYLDTFQRCADGAWRIRTREIALL